MLLALRNKKSVMTYSDIDTIMNRVLAGWQSSDHEFTEEMIRHICVHEMGHVIVGLMCKYHSKIVKVAVNLASPKSPAYTVFEGEDATIYTRQSLIEHIMILLAGRIAENEIYGSSFVSTGASNDFEESIKLAQKMVMYYGMGKSTLYPNMSEKYKEMIDKDVFDIITDAYHNAEYIIRNSKNFILYGAEQLQEKKVLTLDQLYEIHDKI
jgi:cell division protease FtsH